MSTFFKIVFSPVMYFYPQLEGNSRMKNSGGFLIVFFTAMFLVSPVNDSHARYNPHWKWRTVKSGNFTIYYPEGHEAFARRVIDLSPEVYRDVTGYLGYTPNHLPVVLNPGTDIFNGFCALFPNRISLFETPMFMLRGFGNSSSDLLDLVYTHEYTHYVHITTRFGLYRLSSRIFGEGIGILNALSPSWYLEGVTTNTETIFTDGGRGRSPEFKGSIRSFTDNGPLWNLSAAGTYPYYNPPGDRFYLSGYHLVNYLNRIHGEDAFARISRLQGSNPFRMPGSAFRRVAKESPGHFYKKFLADFNARADSIRFAARATGLPEGDILRGYELDGFHSHFWTPEGNIRALRAGYERNTALLEISPENGRIIREFTLGSMYNLKRIRPLPDGRFVYGRPFYHPLGETELDTADLETFNPETGERTRLTRGRHAYTPAVSPDGRTIVTTARNGMWMDLLIMDADGKNIRPLISRDGLYWDAPMWSPDGSTIAAVIKEGGRNGIVFVNAREGGIHTLFALDSHGYNDPSFSPDGYWLLFTSDRSGVWNVYAHDLRKNRTFRLTAVPYDSEEPLVSPDGRTLSFLYLSRGLSQVRTIPFSPEAGEEISFVPGGPYTPPESADCGGKIAESRGIPLRAYTPYLRIPTGGVDENGSTIGLFLLGGDPVGVNTYQVTGLYGPDSERFEYAVNFTNRSLWPSITLRAYDSSFEGNTIGGGDDFWFRERGGEFSLGLPVIHRIAPSGIMSSYRAGARIRKFDGLDGVTIDPKHDISTALFGEFTLSRIPESPARDLTPGWGQAIFIGYEKSMGALGSELPGRNTVIQLTQYAPSPFDHHGFAFSFTHQNQNGSIHYDTIGAIPRGYDDDDSGGGFNRRNTVNLSLDYHFPLWFADRGLGMTLLHLHLLRGSLFVDHGAGWNGDFNMEAWESTVRTSVGGTLVASTTTFYVAPIDFGVAVGYRTIEEDWFFRMIYGLPIPLGFGGRQPSNFKEYLRGLRWKWN
jgi:hypothetical protein